MQGKQQQLGVQVYISDGRGLSEWFSGSTSGSKFVAKSDTGYAQAKGTLGKESVRGTVQLATARRSATRQAVRRAPPASTT